jgi:hypothetical protein
VGKKASGKPIAELIAAGDEEHWVLLLEFLLPHVIDKRGIQPAVRELNEALSQIITQL